MSFLGRLLGYMESELDPIVHSEILVESARSEARVAVLEILACLGFAIFYGPASTAFQAVAIFTLITVVPLLVDSAVRRSSAKALQGKGPQPRR